MGLTSIGTVSGFSGDWRSCLPRRKDRITRTAAVTKTIAANTTPTMMATLDVADGDVVLVVVVVVVDPDGQEGRSGAAAPISFNRVPLADSGVAQNATAEHETSRAATSTEPDMFAQQ